MSATLNDMLNRGAGNSEIMNVLAENGISIDVLRKARDEGTMKDYIYKFGVQADLAEKMESLIMSSLDE